MDDVNQASTSAIRFTATVSSIESSTIVQLPTDASERLPSRGQVAVRGTMNRREFRTVLEPDGVKGHWIRIEQDLRAATAVSTGDVVNVDIEVTRDWPEPDLPDDLSAALAAAPQRIRDV